MNSSLLSMDRATHLRIVITGAFGALLVILVGLGARDTVSDTVAKSPAVQGQQLRHPGPGTLVVRPTLRAIV